MKRTLTRARFGARHSVALSGLVLVGLAACEAPTDGASGTSSEPIINGTPLLGADGVGTVVINNSGGWGCSGTMLTDRWVLTAHHCVTVGGQLTTGGTPVTPSSVTVTLNATGSATQTATAVEVVRHPTLDVGLIRLGTSMASSTGLPYSNSLYSGTASSLVGQTLYCQGAGTDTFNQTGFGVVRFANIEVSQLDGTDFRLVPNSEGQIQWHGDSGSSCITKLDGRMQLTGVTSTCASTSTAVSYCDAVSAAAFRDWANGVVGLSPSNGNPTGYVRTDAVSSTMYVWNGDIKELALTNAAWEYTDVSALVGASAAAAGEPLTAHIRSDSTNAIYYRTGSDIAELALGAITSGRWAFTDVSQRTSAPAAAGAPATYVRSDEYNAVVYRGQNGDIYELSLNQAAESAWGITDLSTVTAGGRAPAAETDPIGYVRADGVSAVVYGDTSGNVWELELSPGQWGKTPLSSNLGAPAAASGPHAYSRSDGVSAIVYAGTNGAIYELSLYEGAASWNPVAEISGGTGAPAIMSGDSPSPWVRGDFVNSVVYLGANQHIDELAIQNGKWVYSDLTAIARAPNAISSPSGFVRADNISAVNYRTADEHIHQLTIAGNTWEDTDLTQMAGAGP